MVSSTPKPGCPPAAMFGNSFAFFKTIRRAGAEVDRWDISGRLGLCLHSDSRRAVSGSKSLSDDKIAEFMRANTFNTIGAREV